MALPGMGSQTYSHDPAYGRNHGDSQKYGHDPAHGCQPEWPGQFSGKFCERGTAKPVGKKMVETNIRNGLETGLARNGFGQYFTDTRGLASTESKKIINFPGSDVFEWKSSKRTLSAPGEFATVKNEGTGRTEPAPGKALAIRERRHIRIVESKEEVSDRPVGPQMVIRQNGIRASDQPAREVDITYEMQRKVPHYSLEEMRHGIGCKAYGDKAYKHPEYSDRFFKMGQLVVGAGFQRGHYKRTIPRNETDFQLAQAERKVGALTFEEKEKQEAAFEARTEVEELTRQWEKNVLRTAKSAAYEPPSDSDDEPP